MTDVRFPRGAVLRSILQAQTVELSYVALPWEALCEIDGELPVELHRCGHERDDQARAVIYLCLLPADRCADAGAHGYAAALTAPYAL